MERYHRKTPLDVLKSMWVAIREASGEELEHTRLVKHLQKLFTSAGDQIESYVSNAVVDGLIQIVDKPKKPKPKSVYHYALPDANSFSFPEEHPDVYCYECHLEGTVLKCQGCVRVFHRQCVQTSADKQLEMERFTTKYKRVNISDFGVADVTNREISSAASVRASRAANSVSPVPSPQVDANENHALVVDRSVSRQSVKNEVGVKQEDGEQEGLVDEAQFVRVVRPPDRRLEERLNTPTVKPEDNGNSIMDSEEFMRKYCYPCRQVHGNQYNMPPNMSRAELNYLLKFVVEQYQSWLPDDTYSPTRLFNNRPRASEVVDNMELCKKLLLRLPITLDDIQQKIVEAKYGTLEEFSADIQDIAHNIAIIHGSNSLEYNAVMYFVTDCVYDLYEIRQCPDCFRHSNEKAEPDWFARPCITRHELVFAKQKGYQHWPAKVIRVYNNKYDVRFFGDKHSRAVVDATSVKPIDTDFDVLKINPKQRGFQKAMDELHKHQALTSLPKDYYSYGSQTATPVNVMLRNAKIGALYTTPAQTGVSGKKRGRKPKIQASQPANLTQEVSVQDSESSLEQTAPQLESSETSIQRHSTQNSPDTRSSRQKEKRLLEPVNNENSPSPPKRIRPNYDIVPLNGSSPSAITPNRSNGDTVSESSGPSNESFKPRSPRIKAQLKRQYSDDVVKLKALMDEMNEIEKIKQLAVNALQEDINRWQQKIRTLVAEYNIRITEVKHKQWCNSCEHESILHCCWNTSYCSRSCQEKDWPDHKKLHKFAKQ